MIEIWIYLWIIMGAKGPLRTRYLETRPTGICSFIWIQLMAPSPTRYAPTTIAQLKELLQDDIKVKVAGTYRRIPSPELSSQTAVRC